MKPERGSISETLPPLEAVDQLRVEDWQTDLTKASSPVKQLRQSWQQLKAGGLYRSMVDCIEEKPARLAVVCCFITAWQKHHDDPESFEKVLDTIPDLFTAADRYRVEEELRHMAEISSDLPRQVKAPTIFAYIGNALSEKDKQNI